MNEYMIRFADGIIKHIKADSCVFTNLPNSGHYPCVVFYKNNNPYYVLTLDSISAIRFPETEEVKNDTDDNSRTSSEV